MPLDNTTPDLPANDPKADRGNEVPAPAAQTVELSADELKAIGRAPAAAESVTKELADTMAAAEAAAEADDGAKEAAKELAKDDAKKADDAPAKEAAKEPAKVEDPPRDKDGKFIPKARFDEVNNRAKAKVADLERQNKDLKTRLGMVDGKMPDTVALEADLDAKTLEYTKLVADAQIEAAHVLMKDINKINRQIAAAEMTRISSEHATETQAVDSLGELVTLFKSAYPVFDDASPDYNQGHVEFVGRLQGKLEATGSSPAEALREAVELAVAKFGLDVAPATEAAEAAPAKPKTKGDERKESAVDAAIRAAGAQPASTAKAGADSDKAGLSKVTLEQISDYKTFEALAKSESTLQRLRGDIA